jgi:hypothetical protein
MKRTRLRLDPASYKRLCREVMERDGWGCQSVVQDRICRFTTTNFAVVTAGMKSQI